MASLEDYGLGQREARLFARRTTRIIYVMGDCDTGKSTLVQVIAAMLARTARTAVVDLDAGQASIGLPTAFAWALYGRRGCGKARGMFFTGTTSPVGYFAESISGAAAMTAEARAAAEKVVIDTCGLVAGELGRSLHHPTIKAVRPDVIVAIQGRRPLDARPLDARPLDGLLGPFEKSGRPCVVRASVPEAAHHRSAERRRSYRAVKFREYFETAGEIELSLDTVDILRPKDDPAGRICSLRSRSGRDVALGIVQRFGRRKGRLTVLTPFRAGSRVRAVVLGAMRIARDGRQLARNV